jgi:8-oxo-dGTP pyrophosphatase MutT (NUDIX family)
MAGAAGREASLARIDIRVPGGISGRAREILEGRQAPAQPRDAATVMLLRPAEPKRHESGADRGDAEPLRVYLIRRKASMAFAPGAFVFPGGSVDPRDADAEVAWAGPDAAEWAAALDTPEDLARALVCAAVRETFEECGVLLAGPAPGEVVADTRGDDWQSDRRALVDRSVSLAGLLGRRGLVLRSDLLKPWARWITPEIESRRFDTRFFAAALPAGQRTADVAAEAEGEADAAAWVSPSAAIAAARRKEILLMPPTAVSLAELAEHSSVESVLAARRQLSPTLPAISLVDGELRLDIPDVEYPL